MSSDADGTHGDLKRYIFKLVKKNREKKGVYRMAWG